MSSIPNHWTRQALAERIAFLEHDRGQLILGMKGKLDQLLDMLNHLENIWVAGQNVVQAARGDPTAQTIPGLMDAIANWDHVFTDRPIVNPTEVQSWLDRIQQG